MARSCRGFVGAEGAALAEQLIDQRGLAVVDVGDDREVAEALGHETGFRKREGQASARLICLLQRQAWRFLMHNPSGFACEHLQYGIVSEKAITKQHLI
jgi:hypothetical protein